MALWRISRVLKVACNETYKLELHMHKTKCSYGTVQEAGSFVFFVQSPLTMLYAVLQHTVPLRLPLGDNTLCYKWSIRDICRGLVWTQWTSPKPQVSGATSLWKLTE